jgi:Fe-Mn family superoxide dismutase
MAFKLPELKYSYESMEPHIDGRTMEIHHKNHHETYVKNLNAALEGHPALQGKPVEEMLMDLESIPESIRTAVRNNGGGHFNHTLFWSIMRPGKEDRPDGKLAEGIMESFHSFDEFKESFKKAALARFGSGWVWLLAKEDGKPWITSTPNQDSPLMEGNTRILMGLDVWEHAYYLKYQSRRAEYVDAWWHLVDWEEVARRYDSMMAHSGRSGKHRKPRRAA